VKTLHNKIQVPGVVQHRSQFPGGGKFPFCPPCRHPWTQWNVKHWNSAPVIPILPLIIK